SPEHAADFRRIKILAQVFSHGAVGLYERQEQEDRLPNPRVLVGVRQWIALSFSNFG
ncbi:hypothetical protein BGX29_010896, partial [Mortierella sp. GBA35]